jgi:TatA/E family protein of Tat protein translocase
VLDLSPTKLIIIFVVVVVLLGPKRLPEVARQLGAGWRKLRELHLQLDRELRQSIPDLPSSQEIVRLARSPVTLLNQLADRSGSGVPVGAAEAPEAPEASEAAESPEVAETPDWGGDWDETTALQPIGPSSGVPEGPGSVALFGLGVDDPNLN